MSLPLLALAVASFGIGMTEFVIMGLLPDLARDLGVTIPEAGMLVSGYALGVVVGAPLMAIATASAPRRGALTVLMGIFLIGNVACALAPGYWWLMAARVVTAFSHAAFFGLGAVAAAEVVAPNKRTQAVALMFTGLTLANVLGVPIGTAVGQVLGWRATFWGVAAIGAVAMTALVLWLPRDLSRGSGGLIQEFRALGRVQVLLAMLISTLASASLFAVFTYIAPLLELVTGITGQGISLVLLVLGVGLTLGNLLGGRLGDWKLMPVVIGLFVAVAAVLALMSAVAPIPTGAIAAIFLWGVVAFALVSPLQMRVVGEAKGAPSLASTINQGAFNLGNAAGAWISGVALTHGVPYRALPLIGAAIALLAMAFAVLSWALDRRAAVQARRQEVSSSPYRPARSA